MSVDALFRPFTIKGLTLPNRIVMAPMTRSFSPGGIPTADVAAYYRRRAEGQVGLIVTEGTVVDRPAAQSRSRLGRSLGRCRCGIVQAGGRHGANIIDTGRRHLGDRRNIVQQCKQAACHALSFENAAV